MLARSEPEVADKSGNLKLASIFSASAAFVTSVSFAASN
jgi:hypothetical protein